MDENIEELLDEIAEKVCGSIYTNYSGRMMFGRTCYGIVCEEPIYCIEEAAANGIRGARYDQMGLQYIVYWPDLKCPEVEA